MPSKQITLKRCPKCKRTSPTTDFHIDRSNPSGISSRCKECRREDARIRYTQTPPSTKRLTNKTCSLFLGVTVAEQVLSNVFNDVKQMPPKNSGYDFVCNHGKKIDVKSACKRKHSKNGYAWQFNIKYNKIADYFLCIAFDNRNDLTPLHLWLLPGPEVNTKGAAIISKSTVHKWNKYKLDIAKTLLCCNAMKT